jgi:hypothetical protein
MLPEYKVPGALFLPGTGIAGFIRVQTRSFPAGSRKCISQQRQGKTELKDIVSSNCDDKIYEIEIHVAETCSMVKSFDLREVTAIKVLVSIVL